MPVTGDALIVKIRCSGKLHRLRVCYGDYDLALLDHTPDEINTMEVARALGVSITDLCQCYHMLRIWHWYVDPQLPTTASPSTAPMPPHERLRWLPAKLREFARAGRETLRLERQRRNQ